MARNKFHPHTAHRTPRSTVVDAQLLTEVEALVPAWLTVAEVAERQRVPPAQVRKQIQDRELVAIPRGERHIPSVPAAFVTEHGPRPELRGTVIVLADGGMSDAELLVWLFTPDPSLPVPGCPLDALLAGHKTEVRRRAMEAAF